MSTTIDQKTTNRLYPKPYLTNSTKFDMPRLNIALDSIDADVASLLASFAAKANLADPVFTGNPQAPTQASNDSSASIATTAFVQAVLAAFNTTGFATVASPTFTGNPQAPTPSIGDNSQSLATTAFVAAKIAALIGGAPGTLDTLNEIAAALGNDPNLATTLLARLTAIETQRTDYVEDLVPSSNTGTPLQYVDISAGRCRFGNMYVVNASVMTKRLNTAWAAGNNAGFLDTGAMAAANTYHIWVLRNIATPTTIDFIASIQNTSAAVTVPAGWEILPNSRIGCVLTNSSNQINVFKQVGNQVMFMTNITEFTVGSTLENTAYNLNGAPNGVSVDVRCFMQVGANSGSALNFRMDTQKTTSTAGFGHLYLNVVNNVREQIGVKVRTTPSGLIWWSTQVQTGSGDFTLSTQGYEDYTVPRKAA